MNLLVAGGSGADTIGHNYMLIIVALAFIAAAAGRIYGHGVLIRRFPRARIFQILG